MEELIAKVIEQSVVSGGFILLLYFVLNKQEIQLKRFAEQMEQSNIVLSQISTRLESLERRDQERN